MCLINPVPLFARLTRLVITIDVIFLALPFQALYTAYMSDTDSIPHKFSTLFIFYTLIFLFLFYFFLFVYILPWRSGTGGRCCVPVWEQLCSCRSCASRALASFLFSSFRLLQSPIKDQSYSLTPIVRLFHDLTLLRLQFTVAPQASIKTITMMTRSFQAISVGTQMA